MFGTRLFTILFLLCLAWPYQTQAQQTKRHRTFEYNVNDGLLQSTISDLAVDSNNYCWISFPNGLQFFDGEEFTTVPVQQGLPNDQFVKFFRCSNGNLMLAHKLGVSMYNWRTHRFALLHRSPQPVQRPIIWVGEYDNVVYGLTENGEMWGFGLNGKELLKVFENVAPNNPFNKHVVISDHLLEEGKAVSMYDRWMIHFDFKNRKYTTHQLPKMVSPYLLGMVSPNTALFRFEDSLHQLHFYHFDTKTTEPFFSKPIDAGHLMRGMFYRNKDRTFIACEQSLMEIDLNTREIKSQIVSYQNQPIGGGSAFARMCADNYGNLYLATIFSGIRKVMRQNLPIRYFGIDKKNANFVLSVYPDKKQNRILVGTNLHGLYIYDTLQKLQLHIPNNPKNGEPLTINCIVKTDNSYLLYPSYGGEIFQLSNNLKHLTSVKVQYDESKPNRGFGFFGKLLKQSPDQIVTQSQANIYQLRRGEKTAKEINISEEYVMSGLYHNGSYIFHEKDQLFFLDESTFKEYKRLPLQHTGYVRCYTTDSTGKIYVGTNKGIFILDKNGHQIKLLNKTDGLPDECIYAMTFDKKGYLWCSSNRGIFRINGNGSYYRLKNEDGLQENEFNTNIVAVAEDGELYFGGVNGVSSFFPDKVFQDLPLPDLRIINIQLNHQSIAQEGVATALNKIDVSHNDNLVAISFTAAGPDNPDQYVYQYRVLGLHDDWVEAQGQRTVRMILPPGKYVFQLFASRDIVQDAVPIKSLLIVVQPPFWKTWWFITLISFVLISLLILFINRYNKRRYQQKLKDLEHRHSLQLQREAISRDLHDNIGAYANAVLYNAGLLENEADEKVRKSLMQTLQFASRDMLLALRETIWAFKKSDYTAQECWLRITNFIQPLTRYYPHIKFSISGTVPQLSLSHQKAFALVRIVQEAVANALKHAHPKRIAINSYVDEKGWHVVVEDDGSGFDYTERFNAATGDGLRNMVKRADRSKFILQTDTAPGKGTRIKVIL